MCDMCGQVSAGNAVTENNNITQVVKKDLLLFKRKHSLQG